jgi:amylosucrase
MYEQVSHSLLNDILIALKPEIKNQKLQHFYTRLGANFYAIHSLFQTLYGDRPDFKKQMLNLVETMARQYIARSSTLKKLDLKREKDHTWFLSQQWVGMALYCDGYADNLQGMQSKLHYLQDLGINLVHIMPLCDCPEGKSDGGYAVRDFRKIDSRFGTIKDLDALSVNLRKRDILLTLDVVVNHTSDEHEQQNLPRLLFHLCRPYHARYVRRSDARGFPRTCSWQFHVGCRDGQVGNDYI